MSVIETNRYIANPYGRIMKYGLVIFDLDGTIVNSAPALINTCHEVQKEMNLPPLDDKILTESIGRNIVESMKDNYGVGEDVAIDFARRFFKYYPKHVGDVKPFDDIIDTVRKVKNNAVTAIATNNDLMGTKRLLTMIGMNDCFDYVRGVIDSNGPSKSDMISDLLNTVGIPSHKAVMIGDSVSDYKAASANNVPFIGASYGYTPEILEQLDSVGNAKHPKDILGILGL